MVYELKFIIRILLLIYSSLFSLNSFSQTEGNQIAGGELNYEFVSYNSNENSNIYNVHLNLFQKIGENIEIYPSQTIWIFNGEDAFFLPTNLPFKATEISSIDTLPKHEIPCAITPDYSLVKVTYSFKIALPVSNSSYFFMWRNCCRTPSINATGQFIGNPEIIYALLYKEISTLEQKEQNNTVQFENYPIPIVCKDEQVEIQNTAFDLDGDQLVYSFHNPFLFGNLDDPQPPPYETVPFISPSYTYDQPFGQNTLQYLDPNTGTLTFTPKESGEFLLGIAVKEYRNGQLISTTYRDLQIIVSDCTPKVEAIIVADTTNEMDEYIVNLCNENSFTIENISTQPEFITSYGWQFEGALNQSLTAWNPSLSFAEGGTYNGQLFLNQNEECPDTANVIINVTLEINAEFDFYYDTCAGGEVVFSENSFSDGGDIIEWEWNFGDSNYTNIVTPSHLYKNPGNYDVQLSIQNEFGCQDSMSVNFDWLPAPPIIIIAPSASEGCTPLEVIFDNLSSPIDSTYEIIWNFGDGIESYDLSPTHVFTDTQNYSVYVSVTSPIGCSIDTTFSNLIEVTPPPKANFTYFPQSISNLNPTVDFFDQSDNTTFWYWNFGDNRVYSRNPTYTFTDTGYQSITLVVEDEYGCLDSLNQIIDVVPEVTYYLPNAFTPNGDGTNDIFKGVGAYDDIQNFKMTIWDRWGGKIFETDNPNKGWNGYSGKGNAQLPKGIYVCNVSYQTSRGREIVIKEYITLIY